MVLDAAVQGLQGALETLSRDTTPERLQRALQQAEGLRLRAEREGVSEVATALWHLTQVLDAVQAGELAAKDAIWNQAKAACRAALAACQVIEEQSGSAETVRSVRALIVGGSEAYVTGLAEAARKKRLDLIHVPDEAEAVVRLMDETFGLVTCIGGAAVDVSESIARLRRLAPEGTPLAALCVEDDFKIRMGVAQAGAQLFIKQSLSADAIANALHTLSACGDAEPPRVMTLVGKDPDEMVEALRDNGIITEPLDEPELLLQAVSRHRPDVLVLDWQVRGYSGLELCRMLRTDATWKWLTVLLRAKERSTEIVTQAFAAGADEVFDRDVRFDELIARIAASVQRSRSFQEDSNRDLLTGLLTRRAFTDGMTARLAEARRGKKLFSLCLLDVDRFKQVNDTRGHGVGDRVLAALGALLINRLRTEDLRGRWGGEEFVVGFFGEWSLSAREILLRVTSEFSRVDLSGGDGDPLHVTVSAGIATFPLDGGTLDDLLVAADRRLYAAKREGRNRINV